MIFVSRISPNRRLEEVAKKIARGFRARAKEIKIISNKPITLRDGTPAYESVIEYKFLGIIKVKSIHLSVLKDKHRIVISIYANANYYNENFRDILYSLEFN